MVGLECMDQAIAHWEDALSAGIPQLGTGAFALPVRCIFTFNQK